MQKWSLRGLARNEERMCVAEDPSGLALPPGSEELMPQEALARLRSFMRSEVSTIEGEWMQVDLFKARIRRLDLSMLPLLHELTVSVFWPHRPPDLEMALGLGKGYIALDEIGRPLGTAMGFPSGEDYAMLGMMVTTPRLQALGTGRRLLRRVMRDQAGRDLRLSATREGYRLYESAGFTPVGLVFQHQGLARAIRPPEPVQGVSVRPMQESDLAAIRALDAHAYGAVRTRVLDALLGYLGSGRGRTRRRDLGLCA